MFFQSYDVKCTATFFSVHSVELDPISMDKRQRLERSGLFLPIFLCDNVILREQNGNVMAETSYEISDSDLDLLAL